MEQLQKGSICCLDQALESGACLSAEPVRGKTGEMSSLDLHMASISYSSLRMKPGSTHPPGALLTVADRTQDVLL
eukprot:4999108-Amphidinium_carterae.1